MSLSTSQSLAALERTSVNAGEKPRLSITRDSPSTSFTKDDTSKKLQPTQQDASRLPTRQPHPKQQEMKKLLVTIPFTLQNKTTSSLDLKAHLLPPSTNEQKTPQTPDNTKELTIKNEETNFKKSEEKKEEPEQLDNDSLFDNFDKYFKIKFPSGKKENTQSQYSPRKINKTLFFNDAVESSTATTSNGHTLPRSQSRPDLSLKYEKPLVRGPSHCSNLQLNITRGETGASLDYCPVVSNNSKNYTINSARVRDEKDKITQETTKYSQLAKERLKLNPILPLPPRGDRKETRGATKYNDFLFNKTDTNSSYQKYDKDPIDTSLSNKNYITDNWKVFERTRERLSGLNHDNSYRGTNLNITVNNSRTSISSRLDKEDYGTDTYVSMNIERRRRNASRRAGADRLSERLITLGGDLDNKENVKPRADYYQKYDRYSRDLTSIDHSSIDETKVTSKTLQTDHSRPSLNLKGINDHQIDNHRRVSGRHALALRDITNQISKISSDGISTRREYYPQAEKKSTDNPLYIPKSAYEILRGADQQREKRRVSHMLLREEGSKRTTSESRK